MLAAGVSVSQPGSGEEHQSPTLFKSLSSKLMRSMRRSSGDQSLQLSTQMSNLGPARQEGESVGAAATMLYADACIVCILHDRCHSAGAVWSFQDAGSALIPRAHTTLFA